MHWPKGKAIRDARIKEGWIQEELAEKAEIDGRTVRRLEAETGGAYPKTAEKVAKALGIPIDQLFSRTPPQAGPPPTAVAGQRAPDPADFLSLADWPAGFTVGTLLVGDRRENPPVTLGDALAFPASTGDLLFCHELPCRPQIWTDKLIKAVSSQEKLTGLLHHDLLIVGSLDVNLAAREVNKSSCFWFGVDSALQAEGDEIEAQLRTAQRDGHLMQSARQLASRLHCMNRQLKQLEIWDPIEAVGPTGACGSVTDCGVVSLCNNPWSEEHVAVLAAGFGGAGTAVAMRLLGTRGAFAKRPLGGVFWAATTQQPALWEERYRRVEYMWTTPEYSLDTYQRDIARLSEQPQVVSPERSDSRTRLLSALRNRGPGRQAANQPALPTGG